MAVRIGQASIDENGRISGGQAGNQSGRELNISNWHNGGWTLLLRPIDIGLADRMAKACEAACRNKSIGYDQNQRNTLREKAKAAGWDLAKIATPCETDCSALMAVCAEAAGVKMDVAYEYGNAPATFQMRKQWLKTGEFQALTDSKYLTSTKYLRHGDVLVKEQSHTVMVLDDGECAGGKNSEIVVNGKSYPIDRMLVGGRNYFQIRDICEVLNQAGLKVEVGNKGNVAVLNIASLPIMR